MGHPNAGIKKNLDFREAKSCYFVIPSSACVSNSLSLGSYLRSFFPSSVLLLGSCFTCKELVPSDCFSHAIKFVGPGPGPHNDEGRSSFETPTSHAWTTKLRKEGKSYILQNWGKQLDEGR